MIKAKFFSILVIVLMVFSTMGGVSAVMTKDTKVVNVDNITDVDNPTVKEIQNAVDSSNDGDTIVIKGSPTDNGEIKSDKVLTIKGENCTFNKIHWIPTKDISFENISFKNSNSDYGGAIKSDGSVNLTNCNFEENSAYTGGGAVWAKNDVIVKNCSFNKNKCSGASTIPCEGGAIYSNNHVVVLDSNFTSNVAANDGGAIYSNNHVEVFDSNFTSNVAASYGGAIYSSYVINATNSIFEDNIAECDGGAMYSTSDHTLWIYYSEFINNHANISGGAIYGSPCMFHCSFVNNSCSGAKVSQCNGGVIYSVNDVLFSDCNFTGNVAADYGGAIYSDTSVIAIDSSFENNSAKDNDGGAIYADDYVKIQNSNFTNNGAIRRGGAIYVDDYGVDISNSSFVNNYATIGGAIWANEAVSVDHCSFNNNSADGVYKPECEGGAIYSYSDGVRLIYSNFTNNWAYDDGGAIYADDYVKIQNSNFTNNWAYDDGGAIYVDDYGVDISNSSFVNNYATIGGAIWANEAVSVDHCSFNNNSADGVYEYDCGGGAIYSDSDGVRLIYSNFTNNFAYQYGGAVWSDDGVTVKDCLFINNSANGEYGGAIYMDDSCDLKVSGSAFYGNHANDKGGAIYCEGNSANVYLDSCNSFENNIAKEGSVVFADGYFKSIKGNWWGSANPNWDDGLLVEWKAWPRDNIKHHDESPLDHNPHLVTPNVIVTYASAKYGENPIFKSNVTYNGEDISNQGTVSYNIYNSTNDENIVDPGDLVAGKTYYVAATFKEYNMYKFAEVTSPRKEFTVANSTCSFDVNVSDVAYAKYFNINVTNATGAKGELLNGTVKATINNKSYVFNIKNGTGYHTVTDKLPVGKYEVNTSLTAPNYDVKYENTSFNVFNGVGSFDVNVNDVGYGDSFIINITNATGTHDELLNGTLNATINHKVYRFNITNGAGSYKAYDNLPVGRYSVKASLEVPNYDVIFANNSFNVTNATGSFDVNVNNVGYGDSFVINVTNATGTHKEFLHNDLLNGTVNVTVTYCRSVSINGATFNTPISYTYSFNVTNGTGSYKVSDKLPIGKYGVNASLTVPNYDVISENTTFNVIS